MAEEKNRISETMENLKNNEKIGCVCTFAKNNARDVVAYILLLIGFIWSFFHPVYGGFLVGIVAGFYFSLELSSLVKNFRGFLAIQGTPRSIVLGVTVILLFIASPAIFIGAALVALIRHFLVES